MAEGDGKERCVWRIELNENAGLKDIIKILNFMNLHTNQEVVKKDLETHSGIELIESMVVGGGKEQGE